MKELMKALISVCIFCVIAGMGGYICAGGRTGKTVKTALSVLVLFVGVVGFGTAAKNIKPNLFSDGANGYTDTELEYDTEAAVIKICLGSLENMGIENAEIHYEGNTLYAGINDLYSDKADDAEQLLRLLTGDNVNVIIGGNENER